MHSFSTCWNRSAKVARCVARNSLIVVKCGCSPAASTRNATSSKHARSIFLDDNTPPAAVPRQQRGRPGGGRGGPPPGLILLWTPPRAPPQMGPRHEVQDEIRK